MDVLQRILFKDGEVGTLSGSDGTVGRVNGHQLGGVDGAALDRFHRRHSILNHQYALIAGKIIFVEGSSRVGSQGDLNSGLMGAAARGAKSRGGRLIGVAPKFFDEPGILDKDCDEMIFTETIANPSIKVLDFGKIAAIAQKHGVLFAVDNTLATPVLCRPFELGANLIIHSSSKYLDGHAAALGGVIVDGGNFDYKGNHRYESFNVPDESYHGLVYADLPAAQFATKCRAQMIRDIGAIMSPQNAFLSWLGCDTLALRMERHSSNAKKVAAYLDSHPKIDWVWHASLPSNQYHALAEKYLPKGQGGMLSFGIKGDVAQAARFMEALQLITQETHVADVRSCVPHPASTTHRQLTKEELEQAGVPENLVRLSVGIENPDDIIADLDQALARI